MATPALQVNALALNIVPGSAGKARVTTTDVAGAPLNVSSGYTVTALRKDVAAAPNALHAAADIKSNFTFAFDTTGIDITWSASQATAIAEAMESLSMLCGLLISNDGGTTSGLAAMGSLSLNAQPYLR